MEKLDLGVPSGEDLAAPDEVSMRIVEKLEETLGRDATQIEPLAASLDPDALDQFVSSAPVGTVIAFTHDGCQIQLRKDTACVLVGVSTDADVPN